MTGVAAIRSAEETARLAAEIMWASDAASKRLGMELVAAGPGSATLAMIVTESMANGHDTAHGGFIFSLADSAFAYACNSYGVVTLAAHCSITFIRPAKRGDRLVADAREVSRSERSGIYDVRVSTNGVSVAEFRGHCRAVGGSFIDPKPTPPHHS